MTKFELMEPIIIYPTNGGNGFYIEPVRGKLTTLIGKYDGYAANSMSELREFLDSHFESLGRNRAT